MAAPIIYGPTYSTYTRTARLALEEKGAAYELAEVDLLKGEAQRPDYLGRHPFGRVPAFEHDGFMLYETNAIVRYVDQVFPGLSLTPSDPGKAARMNQVIGIIDSYGYSAIVLKLFWQRLVVPMMGGEPDLRTIEDVKPTVRKVLSEFERLKGDSPFLAGPSLSLADIYLAPVISHFRMTPDAEEMLSEFSGLRAWWDAMSTRASMANTQPRFG